MVLRMSKEGFEKVKQGKYLFSTSKSSKFLSLASILLDRVSKGIFVHAICTVSNKEGGSPLKIDLKDSPFLQEYLKRGKHTPKPNDNKVLRGQN